MVDNIMFVLLPVTLLQYSRRYVLFTKMYI